MGRIGCRDPQDLLPVPKIESRSMGMVGASNRRSRRSPVAITKRSRRHLPKFAVPTEAHKSPGFPRKKVSSIDEAPTLMSAISDRIQEQVILRGQGLASPSVLEIPHHSMFFD